jgi:hypothetical protein
MIIFPPTMGVPGLSVGIDWPWLGFVLVGLAAVLVGGFLGLLRVAATDAAAARGSAATGARTGRVVSRCVRALHLPLRTPLHHGSRP